MIGFLSPLPSGEPPIRWLPARPPPTKPSRLAASVKALIFANDFLEAKVCELMQAVSHAYARGKFKT